MAEQALHEYGQPINRLTDRLTLLPQLVALTDHQKFFCGGVESCRGISDSESEVH